MTGPDQVSPPQEWGIRANEDHHRPAGAHRRCRCGGFVARRWACFRANHRGTARFAGPLPAHPRTRRRVSADHRPDPLRGELGADDDVRARRGRRGHRTCRCAPPRCGRQSDPRSAFHGLDTNQAAYDALHAAGVDIKWAPNDAIYHQKPIVVDHTIAAVGTGNLTKKYYATSPDAYILTTSTSDVVAIAATFDADFTDEHLAGAK